MKIAGTDAILELGTFSPLPDDPRRWIEGILTQDLPDGARIGDGRELPANHELGWPMEMALAIVVDAAGKTLEHRLGAFYKFNEWVTYAMARGTSLETEALLAALRSGRPRWQSTTVIAAISELWS